MHHVYNVITIAREYGSGGSSIAKRVAELLQWKLLDKNLIARVARAAQVDLKTANRYDESVDSWWSRFNRSGLWAAALAAGVSPAVARFFDADSEAAVAAGLIMDAARQRNCVIVGRGGQCVLQGCPEAFHVFIYGSWEERVARIETRLGPSCDIDELLRSSDRMRSAYIRRHFGRDWKDPHLYHMMIGAQLGDDEVARLIVGAVEGREVDSVAVHQSGQPVAEVIAAQWNRLVTEPRP